MNPSFSWKLFKIIQQLILSIDQESCLQETQKPGDAFWYMFLFISNPKLPGSYIVFFFFLAGWLGLNGLKFEENQARHIPRVFTSIIFRQSSFRSKSYSSWYFVMKGLFTSNMSFSNLIKILGFKSVFVMEKLKHLFCRLSTILGNSVFKSGKTRRKIHTNLVLWLACGFNWDLENILVIRRA